MCSYDQLVDDVLRFDLLTDRLIVSETKRRVKSNKFVSRSFTTLRCYVPLVPTGHESQLDPKRELHSTKPSATIVPQNTLEADGEGTLRI
jgi:hypothetical protein